MSHYVINPTSAVVHTSMCQNGPMNSRSVGGYEKLPTVVLEYLPSRLFCKHCCSHLIRMSRERRVIEDLGVKA